MCFLEFSLWWQQGCTIFHRAYVDHPVSLYAATKKVNELVTITIAICTESPQLVFGFSRCMDPRADRIWPIFLSPGTSS